MPGMESCMWCYLVSAFIFFFCNASVVQLVLHWVQKIGRVVESCQEYIAAGDCTSHHA